MLKNPDNDSYGDYQVKLDINSYKYNIGGYSSYQTQYEKKDKETNTVLRFSLTKSNNNYLFESANELFSISTYVSQFKHKTRKHTYVNFWSHKLCFL
ncbi:hypothetical protein MmmBen_0966 [Mycoplasma mycoides subsp. mycoides]|uniref:Uncharacterized protein n=1 Tax=Mycoplasma mycoides subsp. mycoides SC (strain CCUG 32753 / NCTC 10114 / PG1) TaxID=272632 RepID=Q6MS60_MYCMS|nr:hypothetical protein [Mycoplasma mycoides]ADK70052.1 conserved hypothetical protein [Mycoplasma mycoides subsp. mycoides SC str. Gladysdale]QQY78153.1 hypothetical protein JLS56_04575 [Mycoplasma mycoides subsp. capri]CAE77530.1 Conserved hypothetical protein [Mycoplasma mycoides subsp. mycoides SC str. PG1]AIZ55785.1 hypothetical protein mycmycITA_00972 [Mycoplasma mycoides subsp. mycoides]AME11098.1 hypothetical protein MmmBen_0966 [Mycoplasma mycoides subsp. mycoides]